MLVLNIIYKYRQSFASIRKTKNITMFLVKVTIKNALSGGLRNLTMLKTCSLPARRRHSKSTKSANNSLKAVLSSVEYKSGVTEDAVLF